MEIRILGPLEILDAGVPVTLPAAERALVARLACAGSRGVGRDRLIDDLWPHRLPADPLNALQLRVSKVRRVLPGAISSDRSGYRLDTSTVTVDAHDFQQLITGRRFDEALALWRGDALGDQGELDWARAEAARLDELRFYAVEELAEARLASGEHRELVVELQSLVAATPLRERLRGQLMLALHRSGRTSEALAVYRDGYRLMDEAFGLTPSEHLHRLQEGILRQDAALEPAPRPERTAGNIPAALSRLVGREDDLARLAELSSTRRLITLTGPGGAGKTALALEAARRAGEGHADGVWVVRLADIGAGSGIVPAVARALDLPEGPAPSVELSIVGWLASRQVLMLLDNCEHVVEACAVFVESLLQRTGDGVRVIATSREALGVPGEVQVPVPPLPLADAVGLFADRAAAVRVDAVRPDDEDVVARICEGLDGMPLAIELAAARVTMLSPAQILARMDDRFSLLTGGHRTAEGRHQTLRRVVDWSHDLLNPQPQALFRHLAVFSGGWTLEAAQAVCGNGDPGTLDLLSRLVDQSLLIAHRGRFGMLETIRAYAADRLAEDPLADQLRRRHAEWFTALAEAAEAGLRGPHQQRSLEQLQQEEPNLERALEWTRSHADSDADSDHELGLRLAASLGWYWYVGRQVDGRRHLMAALDAAPSTPSVPRARAVQSLSLALRPAGCLVHPHPDAADAARESATMFTELAEPERAALSQLLVAVEGVAGPDVTASRAVCSAARAVLAEQGDAWGTALADFVDMELLLRSGDMDGAMTSGRQAAATFDGLADDWGRSAVRLHLGIALRMVGRNEEAESVLNEAVALSRQGHLPNNLARSLVELGECAVHRGDAITAERWFAEADEVARTVPDGATRALIALGRGTAARLRGHLEVAVTRYEESVSRFEAAGVPIGHATALAGLAAARVDQGDIGPETADLADASRSLATRLGDGAVEALAVAQLGRIALLSGASEHGRALLSQAADLRRRQQRPPPALLVRDLTGSIASPLSKV